MPSKLVVQRIRSSRVVVQAARVHGTQVASDVRARLGEDDPGAAGVAALIESLAADLETATTRMDSADADHEAELADDTEPRRARDEANEALVQALVGLRGAVQLAYGDAAAVRLGFNGQTAREPTMVATLATRVLERTGLLAGLPVRVPGLTLDLTPLVQAVAEPLARLQPALDDVASEAREAEQTLVAKHNAIAAYDALFGAVATTLEGLFSLAGSHELARRVRPSRRRPGQVELEEGAGDEGTAVDAVTAGS
jgi:hypothetical protein